MDISVIICIICCISYNLTDVLPISILVVELPKILYRNCTQTQLGTLDNNSNDSSSARNTCQETNSWQQPGIIIAANNGSGLIFSVLVGYLVSKCDSRYIFLTGLITHTIGSLLIAVNDAFLGGNVPLLTFAVFVDGAGGIIGGVSYSDIVRRLFPKDSVRCRLLHLVSLARVIGYGSGYYLGTLSYEYLGSVTTFINITCTFAVQALALILSMCLSRNKFNKQIEEEGCTHPLLPKTETSTTKIRQKHQEQKDSKQTSNNKSYKAIFTNPYTMILCLQFTVTHFGIATVLATAPSRLQLEIGFDAVQNGMITGLGLVNTFIILILILLFVKQNFVRVNCMILFILIEIAGFVAYPFVSSFLFAVFSETCIHAARNSLNSFGSSILMLITDNFGLDYGKANGLYILCRYSSQSISSFLSVFLIEALGFNGLYFAMAVCLLPVALVSVIYLKLVVKM